MVEQDDSTKIAHLAFKPLKYFLATSSTPFIKALAFNIGFKNITQDKVILHDADMLVQNDYTTIMDTLLDNHEGVHLGKNVLYLTREATAKLASTGILAPDLQIERTVGYFEGGSLGCTRKAYFDAGGFNEDFVGYGCEDTNFFQRLSSLPTFYNQRTLDFIHLWHDRNPGWMEHHRKNKAIYASCALRPMVLQCSDLRNRLISKYGLK
jgi:predicted glycosyltransferase involved in capsule biosynthesis